MIIHTFKNYILNNYIKNNIQVARFRTSPKTHRKKRGREKTRNFKNRHSYHKIMNYFARIRGCVSIKRGPVALVEQRA